ncbi:hypothetical protein Celaphus_00014302 [Cervus elaphus hippelaphus]|uniref:Uncharacterized protein n=1 Tax=Cervus elaphus hippelaphus TaxID=46360 RepID=A0A212D4C9_CEREH|nr:hypothetical protein Celaphus_00014302 [Cervus elaphus hippelaphus]
MSLLNSGWPHQVKRLASPELNPPVNSDSNPDHMPKEDPEETSAQDPEVLSWGHPGLDTTPAPSWPGLRSLLQQLPPQDSDTQELSGNLKGRSKRNTLFTALQPPPALTVTLVTGIDSAFQGLRLRELGQHLEGDEDSARRALRLEFLLHFVQKLAEKLLRVLLVVAAEGGDQAPH